MRAGCPVIATAASSIPEVAGDAALLVSANESRPTEAMAEMVRQLKNGTVNKQELRARGFANAMRFSWDATYQQTVQFYQDISQR